jgi:hypothetical protein
MQEKCSFLFVGVEITAISAAFYSATSERRNGVIFFFGLQPMREYEGDWDENFLDRSGRKNLRGGEAAETSGGCGVSGRATRGIRKI